MKRTPLKRSSKGLRVRIDPLDALVSECVRRSSNGYCQRCGRYHGWKGLQAAHYHKRRKISTRYDSDNLLSLCFGCHQFFEENRDEHEFFMLHHLGEERFNMLNSRMRITHPKPDKKLLTLYYTALLKELRNGE